MAIWELFNLLFRMYKINIPKGKMLLGAKSEVLQEMRLIEGWNYPVDIVQKDPNLKLNLQENHFTS